MVGHRDRSASVTCSSACVMPARSRDLAALRRFAEAHALAHARAAAVRADAACWCRHQRCAPHEGTRVSCGGAVVLVLRHDPAVGQVWTLSEVCSACAPLMSHARVMARAARPAPPLPRPASAGDRPASAGDRPAAGDRSAPRSGPGAAPFVPGGFSAPPADPGQPPPLERRRRGRRRGRPEWKGSAGP
ncbi:hypothetical protein [Streptomyces sp. Ru71]|uniref:hypothetical protein n=1 Tax=Streptomyces sp. Ru71 TaxID=2080746 RepID=UPI002156348E|nr:hypothetical protein [Streptomyces sp. Ru71]